MIVDEVKQRIIEEQEFGAIKAALESKTAAYELMDKCKDYDFFCQEARKIFRKLVKLGEEMQDITLGNLKRTLSSDKDLGTIERILKLDVNPEDMEDYIKFIKEQSKKRQLHEIGNTLRKKAYEDDVGSELLIHDLMQSVVGLAQDTQKRGFVPAGDLVNECLENIAKRSSGGITGFQTGFPALDQILGGYQPGDLIIVAARPSQGKTLLAIQSAIHLAHNLEINVPFFSLEMSKAQILDRVVSHLAMVNHFQIKSGKLSKRQWEDVRIAAELVRKMPLFIDDSGVSLSGIIAKTKQLLIKRGSIGPIFIDYLNNIEMGGGGTRNEDVTRVVAGLKNLAKDLEVPVILLCQLNRGVESRDEKRPELSDLRDSGSIEQSADIVIFPFRPYYYSKDELEKKDIELIVRKHRNGLTGTIKGQVDLDIQRIDVLGVNTEEEDRNVI